jgi:hypothetical protein
MENKLKGGKSDGMTIEDIAKKHKMDVGLIKIQLENGIKVEREHTTDKGIAKEIAMDHLFESPDYYIKLSKMEKKLETKEQTMSDASGSFESPIFGKTILKKNIYKIPNFKTLREQMDAGVSAGAMYDGPIGTAGPSSPKDRTKKKRKDPLALDEKDGNATASITAASTDDMISTKKGFPRFGGPDAKFVEIDAKCKKFPYCNQGDSGTKFKFISEEMDKAVQEASKKYGVSVEEVKKIVSEALPVGMFDNPGNMKAMKSWTDKGEKDKFHIRTKHPLDIKTDDDIDVAKLKGLFYRYDIPFDVHKIN